MSDLEQLLARALAGRYRIERELGEGGMAIVYAAEDLRHQRKVAIKVLKPELSAELGAERFLREIAIAGALRHPHIIPLYDSGDADGLLFYAMPLVEGESLRARIDRERQLPIDDALRYAREVADALSYAHAHGVVHRDIKPENILIESGHAVVADFGIALARAAAGRKGRLTGSGMALGTPAYMSPEQAAGDRDVDGRSDLYSLGCVLFEMLAGAPPFHGVTHESLARQHVMSDPPPVTQFRPAVPAAVNDALMRALAKSPADRFNPVGQFAAALGEGTTSTGSVVRTRPSVRRLTIAAAVIALLAVGLVWAFARRDPLPASAAAPARSIAVLPFENMGGDTAIVPLLLGIHAEMVTQLTKIGSLKVASRTSTLEYRNSTKSDRAIASEMGVATLLRGAIQRSGNQVRVSVNLADAPKGEELWAESYDRAYTAENLFEVQADIARQVAAALRVQLSDEQQQELARAPTTNLGALDAYYRALVHWDNRGPAGDDTLTVRYLERAVSLDTSFVAAWSLLAQARGWLVRRYLAHDTLPAWRAVQRTQALAPGSLDAVLATAYYRYYARGDFAGALDELSAADRMMPTSSEIPYVMALVERRLGRWDEAVERMERSLERDPRNVRLIYGLAETLLSMRRFGETERGIDRALAIQPRMSTAIAAKVNLLHRMGDTARARTFLRTAGDFLPSNIRAGLAGQVELFARDYSSALRHLAGASIEFTGGLPHRNYTSALAARASGDSMLARQHADSFLRAARAELAGRRASNTADPFGRQATIAALMAVTLALRGEGDSAVRLAEASERRYGMARDAIDGSGTANALALTYMLVGRRADAIAVLERLLAVPSSVTVHTLRLSPLYDDLRGEPAFQRLVASAR